MQLIEGPSYVFLKHNQPFAEEEQQTGFVIRPVFYYLNLPLINLVTLGKSYHNEITFHLDCVLYFTKIFGVHQIFNPQFLSSSSIKQGFQINDIYSSLLGLKF